jgi:hypothetical protein
MKKALSEVSIYDLYRKTLKSADDGKLTAILLGFTGHKQIMHQIADDRVCPKFEQELTFFAISCAIMLSTKQFGCKLETFSDYTQRGIPKIIF